MEDSGEITLPQPVDHLNLTDDLAVLKDLDISQKGVKMFADKAELSRTLPSLSGCFNMGVSFPILSLWQSSHSWL